MAPLSRRRRLTIADVMILLVALAIGLFMIRTNLPIEFEPLPRKAELIPNVVSAWAALLFPSLVFWTLTVALLALRPPRLPLRRLARLPGFVACGSAAVIVAAGAAVNVLHLGVGAILR